MYNVFLNEKIPIESLYFDSNSHFVSKNSTRYQSPITAEAENGKMVIRTMF